MAREKTILIIEQEVNLANGLKAILEKEDYQVISTYSLYAIKDILLLLYRYTPILSAERN